VKKVFDEKLLLRNYKIYLSVDLSFHKIGFFESFLNQSTYRVLILPYDEIFLVLWSLKLDAINVSIENIKMVGKLYDSIPRAVFTNILLEAFTLVDHESVKKYSWGLL